MCEFVHAIYSLAWFLLRQMVFACLQNRKTTYFLSESKRVQIDNWHKKEPEPHLAANEMPISLSISFYVNKRNFIEPDAIHWFQPKWVFILMKSALQTMPSYEAKSGFSFATFRSLVFLCFLNDLFIFIYISAFYLLRFKWNFNCHAFEWTNKQRKSVFFDLNTQLVFLHFLLIC